MSPLISVLLPVFNGQAHIRDSILSVRNQHLMDFEIIVINDGSTDDTTQIIESIAREDSRIRILHNPRNLGLAASLNAGLAEAKGKYIARQDADDLSMPNRFEHQIAYLESHPEIGMVSCGMELFYPDKAQRTKFTPVSQWHMIVWNLAIGINPINHPGVMVQTSVLNDAGGYNEDFPAAQDFELWSRLIFQTKIQALPEALIYKREHEQQLSEIYRSRKPEYWKNIVNTLGTKLLQRELLPDELDALLAFSRGHGNKDKQSLVKAIPVAMELADALGNHFSLTPEQWKTIRTDMANRVAAYPIPLREQAFSGRPLLKEALRRGAYRIKTILPQTASKQSRHSLWDFVRNASSFTPICGDIPHSKPVRWLYMATNRISNNATPKILKDRHLRVARFSRSQSATPLPPVAFTTDSPSRIVCDQFWQALPWESLRRELGEIHVLDIGCGNGNYSEKLRAASGETIQSYHGVDIISSPNWQRLKQKKNTHFSKLTAGLDQAIPTRANLIISQSALEHIPNDKKYMKAIRQHAAATNSPVFQIHLVPSESCLQTYELHGYRQYTLRKASKLTAIFPPEDQRAIYLLGGNNCNALHHEAITTPLSKGEADKRLTHVAEYSEKVNAAIALDEKDLETNTEFLAIVIHSNPRSDVIDNWTDQWISL
ncbi:glycosyltransferase [uncultured Pseudodesulfovibrio sp.]|uniref:glycosyltransferase n=1 Tax=uncultured Pseudodesulfovibrio sp. TaxID=2035858 RepID=UPI0029C924B8|nr:glycosyltransferase [uncultured Pseudodesulfovibrio sp.]